MNANTIGLMFGQSPFHIEVNAGSMRAVSDGTGMQVSLAELDAPQLLELKNLAHNQYVRAMLFDDTELDVYRATLNALCRSLERRGNPGNRVPADRSGVRVGSRAATSRPARAA